MSYTLRLALITVAVLVTLTLAHKKPWQSQTADAAG